MLLQGSLILKIDPVLAVVTRSAKYLAWQIVILLLALHRILSRLVQVSLYGRSCVHSKACLHLLIEQWLHTSLLMGRQASCSMNILV